MAQPWRPEHPVDAALARRLVAIAFPELADLDDEPVHLGAGWDVDVWRFGQLAVRFPRRAAGVACLDNELRVLPALAGALPLPVPRPTLVGEPALGYPSRFYAHPMLPGAPLLRADLDDGARAHMAGPLGRFVGALHARPLAPLRAAGLRDDDRGDVARVAARGRDRLAAIVAAVDPAVAARARVILDGELATDVAPGLIHGDLHPGNLLVDDDGAISGVIDWGDCAAGDPAIDLAVGWSTIPPAARGDFVAAYGDLTAATWARARVHAVSRHGLALLAWALDLGDAALVASSAGLLSRAVS